MKKYSLQARWVVPVSEPPINGGVVSVEDGRVVAVESPQAAQGGVREDLGDVVLMPGLVNAHTHLEFSDCERPLGTPGMAFVDWIRQVIALRKRADRDPRAAIRRGLEESLRAGVTTVGEISTGFSSVYAQQPLSQLLVFQEAIGFSTARCDSVLHELEERLDRQLSEGQTLAGIAPHAPYTVGQRLLTELVSSAQQRCLPIACHLAETRAELELLASGTGPFRALLLERDMWDDDAIACPATPLDYLKMLSAAPRVLVIHGNYLNSAEIEYVAAHRQKLTVVYCPRTHAYFRHEPYPLEKLLTAGVRVALGTDSRASSPDLDLRAEMQLAAQLHSAIPPETIVEMATVAGAEALGLGNCTGTLTPGKWADMIIRSCVDKADPYAGMIANTSAVTRVYVRGRLLNSRSLTE